MTGPPSEESAGNGEQRVAGIAGDRFCIGCGYNLLGQSVLREPHYGMLIVRCPECGAVSSVVEYPRLARWSRGLGAVLAGLWLVFMLFASGMTSWALAGFSIVTTEVASQKYETYLQTSHTEAVEREQQEAAAKKAATSDADGDAGAGDGETADESGDAGAGNQAGNVIVVGGGIAVPTLPGNPQAKLWQDFGRWWKLQDHAAVLAEAGGLRAVIDPSGFFVLIPAYIILFMLGCFWTTALVFARRRWLVAWLLVIGLLAILITAVHWWEWAMQDQDWYWHAARAEVGLRLIWPVFAINIVPLAVGLLLGRPALRLLVRGLLPPRWRGPLAFLWTASGKSVPR